MKSYFESFEQYKARGNSIKTTTITAKELLPALVAHFERMDKQFTLHINGHLPKPIDELIKDAFDQCHLYQPFYTQHCEQRGYHYRHLSKNRIKIDFTARYRMSRQEEKWILDEITTILQKRIQPSMTTLQKILVVHDYIVRTYHYELHTEGSPFAVYTFMKEKHGVCMAYALLFEKMMEHLQIPCYYVIGKADGEGGAGHAWNMVEIDGHWYHIDVTWDDIGSIMYGRQIRYRYFLLSDDVMKKDHQWNLDHYPPCTSHRFSVLHTLYDACIVGETLYFPHPKNALLHEMGVSGDLNVKKCLDARVQFIHEQDGALYFSNYSHKGYLYRYEIAIEKLVLVSADEVTNISSTETGLEITFKNQSTEFIEKTTNTNVTNLESETTIVYDEQFSSINRFEVPLMSLGDSWMGIFEQANEPMPLLFKSADGVELIVDDLLKQLTIDIYFDKSLIVKITSTRREIKLTKPAVLKIPTSLLPMAIAHTACVVEEDYYYIAFKKSTVFKLNV